MPSGLGGVAIKEKLNGSRPNLSPFHANRRLYLSPTWLGGVNPFEPHRPHAAKCDHGRLLAVCLYAVVMRRTGNAMHERTCRCGNGVFRLKIGTAVYPPRAGNHHAQAIG